MQGSEAKIARDMWPKRSDVIGGMSASSSAKEQYAGL